MSRSPVICPRCKTGELGDIRPGGHLRPAEKVFLVWETDGDGKRFAYLRCPSCGLWTQFAGARIVLFSSAA